MAAPLSTQFNVGTEKYTIDRYAPRPGPAKQPAVVILHGVDGLVGESLIWGLTPVIS